MLGFFLYAIPAFALAALVMELVTLRRRGNRFGRLVGVIGLALIAWSYLTIIFELGTGMPTTSLRTGLFLFMAYAVSRGIYELLRR